MAGWVTHIGAAVALPLENVDTDQLIPARFMSVSRVQGYGPYLLHDLRFDAAGAEVAEMPLNRHPEATVLVARRNFGSGSSREAAVYALADYGFRAVIAPSFGDIFAGNAMNNGVAPARLSESEVEDILRLLGEGVAQVTVDLEACRITLGNRVWRFEIDPVGRRKLINGWDDIDLTASHGAEITAFRDARRAAHPWAWPGS